MDSRSKIISVTDLEKALTPIRREKKVAFTNGCFDILHFGHVSYLEKAKGAGRILVVGLNSDASVKRLKGPERPVNSQRARAYVIAALGCVDFVTIFDEDTPYELIAQVKPDILIKGADWKGKTIVGQDIVEANGGRVELIDYVDNFSTTNIIDTIRRQKT